MPPKIAGTEGVLKETKSNACFCAWTFTMYKQESKGALKKDCTQKLPHFRQSSTGMRCSLNADELADALIVAPRKHAGVVLQHYVLHAALHARQQGLGIYQLIIIDFCLATYRSGLRPATTSASVLSAAVDPTGDSTRPLLDTGRG